MFEINPPAIIGEQQAGRSTQIRKQLMLAVEDIKERTFDLALLLYQAKHEGLYRQWGYQSIREYGEVELGLKFRKIHYLVSIVDTMTKMGIPRKDYEPIGTTKLREIARLDPKGEYFNGETLEPLSTHITRLMAEAPNTTASKIGEEVNRLLGMTDGNSMVIRSFSTTQSAWDNVFKPALEILRRKLGSRAREEGTGIAEEYPDGVCYEMAMAEVIADPNNDVPVEFAIEPDEAITQGDIPIEEPTI